jgi:hypothetical protein
VNITVVRSGGFAGLRRTWHVDVDAQPRSVVEEWLQVVDACPWSEAVDLDGDGVPDRFVFVITVDSVPAASVPSGSDSELRATLPETRVVGPWRQLVERVQSADRADTKRP